MSQKQSRRWDEELRPKIDEAIMQGWSKADFCETEGISIGQWARMKPKEFSWSKLQKHKGIKPTRKPYKKREAPPTVVELESRPNWMIECQKPMCNNLMPVIHDLCDKCSLKLLDHLSPLVDSYFITAEQLIPTFNAIVGQMIGEDEE